MGDAVRILRCCVLLVVVGVPPVTWADSTSSKFSLEVGPEFARGLVSGGSDNSAGVALGLAFGGRTVERLWIGLGVGVSFGSSGEWGDVPRVYSLFAGGRWWFSGQGKRLYIPVFIGLSHLTMDEYRSSDSWISPSLTGGLGVSISKNTAFEVRYFHAFDVTQPGPRETSKHYSSVGVLFRVEL
jgi:hypothetical protein